MMLTKFADMCKELLPACACFGGRIMVRITQSKADVDSFWLMYIVCCCSRSIFVCLSLCGRPTLEMRQNTIVLISHQKHVQGDVYGEGWPTLEPFWGGSCKMKPEEHPTLTPP